MGAGNVPTWNAVDIITTTSLNAKIASAFTFNGGLTATVNTGAGTVVASVDQTFQHSFLRFTGSSNTLRNVASGGTDYLTWGPDALVTLPFLNAGLAAQNTALTTAINARQVALTFGAGLSLSGTTLTAPVPASISKLSVTASGISMGVAGDTTLTTARIALYERTGAHQPAGHFFYGSALYVSSGSVGVGHYASTGTAVPDQGSGSGGAPHLFIQTTGRVAIGTISPSQMLHVNGNITCVSLAQTSDRRVKDDIQDADGAVMQDIFDAISSKTYTRNDGVAGKRLGFIAQDVQEKLPEDWTNLVFEQGEAEDDEEPPLLAIDYSRLVTVLWSVVKNMQHRIELLEGKKKKTTKK